MREYNLKHQTHSHVHRRLLPVPSQGFFGMCARFTKDQWSMKFILVVPFVECAKRPPLLFECLWISSRKEIFNYSLPVPLSAFNGSRLSCTRKWRGTEGGKKTEGEYKKYPWEFPVWNPWEFPMWNPWEFPVWNKWWAVENLSVFCRTKWSRYSWKTKKKQMWVTKGGKTCGRLDSSVIYHCTSHFPNSLSTSHI